VIFWLIDTDSAGPKYWEEAHTGSAFFSSKFSHIFVPESNLDLRKEKPTINVCTFTRSETLNEKLSCLHCPIQEGALLCLAASRLYPVCAFGKRVIMIKISL